jgi:hypothetical protein
MEEKRMEMVNECGGGVSIRDYQFTASVIERLKEETWHIVND